MVLISPQCRGDLREGGDLKDSDLGPLAAVSVTASSRACISASTSTALVPVLVCTGAATAARIFNGPGNPPTGARSTPIKQR